jgi:hypothetical protein
MLYAILLTWIITSSVISFGTVISLYLKWKRDDDNILGVKYLMILICLTTICTFLLLPIYLIENKMNIRVNKAYQAMKSTLQERK